MPDQALHELQQQLRELCVRLLTAQESERERISTELHDELGNRLILMKFRLGEIERQLRDDQLAARHAASGLARSIDQVIEDIRRLSRDLRPPVLEDLGLTAALRALLDDSRQTSGAEIVTSLVEVDHLLSPRAQVVLFRIMQEAFANAQKHAKAGRVTLGVERDGDQLAFFVEDDGQGFDVDDAVLTNGSGRGFGLATMRERARMLGGSLSVTTGKGRGTRVTVAVPVREV